MQISSSARDGHTICSATCFSGDPTFDQKPRILRHRPIHPVAIHPVAVVDRARKHRAIRVVPTHRRRPPPIPSSHPQTPCPASVSGVKPCVPCSCTSQRLSNVNLYASITRPRQQRRKDLHRLFADRLSTRVDCALAPQRIEVRQRQPLGAPPVTPAHTKSSSNTIHTSRGCTRTGCVPRRPWRCLLVRPRLPAQDPKQLKHAAKKEDGKEDPDEIPQHHQPAVPPLGPRPQQQHKRRPADRKQQHTRPSSTQHKSLNA